ncbi:MAG: PAS domain S-box protein, partial [Bacteroidota bacterium]
MPSALPRTEELVQRIEALERENESLRRHVGEAGPRAELLQAIVDRLPQMLFVKDGLGRYLLTNEAFTRAAGLPDDALTGQTDHALPKLRPGQIAQFQQHDELVVTTGRDVRLDEHPSYQFDGSTRWSQTTKRALSAGDETYVLGIVTDVTEQRLQRVALERQQTDLSQFSARLRELHRLSTTDYDALDPLLDDLLASGCAMFSMEMGILSRIENQTYTVRASNAPDRVARGEVFDLGTTYCEAVVRTGATIRLADAEALPEYRQHPCYTKAGLRSYIGTPVYAGDELFGTLNFSSREVHAPFRVYDRECIELLAQSIGTWIVSARRERARVAAQQALLATQQSVDQAGDAILWAGSDGRVHYLNETARRLTGHSTPVSLFDLLPGFDAESWNGLFEDLDQLRSLTLEASLVHRSGAQTPVELSLSTLIDAAEPTVCVFARDIRLRKDVERELHRLNTDLEQRVTERTAQLEAAVREQRRSESRFQSIVQNIADLIGILEADGTIRYVSPSVEKYGWRAENVIGRRVFDLMHPEDAEKAMGDFGRTVQTPGTAIPVRYRLPEASGNWVPFATIANNLLDDPSVNGIVIVARDDTERQHYEEGLIMARRAAEQLSSAKTTFLTSITHDLRTPLTSIIGYSELMAEDLDGIAGENAARIRRNAYNLMSTLEAVMDMARLEAGQFEPSGKRFDLTQSVHDGVDLLTFLAEHKQLQVYPDVPDTPIYAEFSRTAFQRIVTNLLSNALKFTDRGCVYIRLAEEDDGIVLEVADTGGGIAEDHLDRLYGEFWRADTTGTVPGSGLGLAITRRLVDLLGGTIRVDSTPNIGSLFTVVLPRFA